MPARLCCCSVVVVGLLINTTLADERPTGLPEDAMSWPELKPSTGTAYRGDGAVYFVLDTEAPSIVTFLRINNPMRAAYWLGDANQQPLTLKPEPTRWSLQLTPAPQNKPPIVVFEVDGEPRLNDGPSLIRAKQQKDLVLPAHLAITHGEMLRYEPQPHKNTIGYWTRPDDWVEWLVEFPSSGIYDVELLQGCGPGQGGSDLKIVFAPEADGEKRELAYQVEETGHFQNFRRKSAGNVEILAGKYRVQLRATKLANKAVMDVREVRLRPHQ